MASQVEKTNNAWIDGIRHIADPYNELENRKAEREAQKHRKVKTGLFSGLFGASNPEEIVKNKATDSALDNLIINDEAIKHVEDLQGMYMYGGPGSGKTFMMDLFYSQVAISNKRRASYTSFVLQIHKMNHDNHKKKIEDPLFKTSWEVAKQYRLFCFDEVQVTEPGDAILMKRFFDVMWQLRVVLVVDSGHLGHF